MKYDAETISRNRDALDRILDKLHQNKILVYLLKPPMHTDYQNEPSTTVRNRLVDELIEHLEPRFDRQDIAVVDYSSWPELNDQDFADWTHLSLTGATKWSDELARQFASHWKSPHHELEADEEQTVLSPTIST